jgi:hypothetical protein
MKRFKDMEEMDAVVLAAGDYPSHDLPRAALMVFSRLPKAM